MGSEADISGNREAEKGIILGMLHYPDVRSGSALALDELLFTDSAYRKLFPILADLGDRKEIDRVALQDMARTHGIKDDLGYLLEEQAPSKDTLRNFYDIVKNRGGMAALASLSQRISFEAQKAEANAFDVSEQVLDELGRIRAACAPLSAELHTMRQPVKETMELMEKCLTEKKGIIPGVQTGLIALDQRIGGLNPGIILIGARPYLGMQDLAINIALNASKEKKVLYVASSVGEDFFMKKAFTILSGLSLLRIEQGYMTPADYGKLTQAANLLGRNQNLYTTYTAKNAEQALQQATYLKGRQGLDLVIVNTFQDLLPEITDYRNSGFLAQQTARTLEKMHTKLGLPVLVLSELSSDVDKRVTTTRPRVGHIRDYGALEYRAQQIMLLHQEDPEDKTGVQIHTDVNKRGFTGTDTFNYDAETGKFSDRARGIEDATSE
jgi:replicative DNA helicase